MSTADPQQAESSLALRLALLSGQGFFLGVALALLNVAAMTLFLVQWGAEWLPWTYIGIAIFVPLSSFNVIRLQQRWSVGRVALAVEFAFAAFSLLAWLGVLSPFVRWVSPFLVISTAYGGLLIAVLIGGLVGRLLDIRQVKRYFPMIRAGVNAGGAVSSVSVPLLVVLLDGAGNLLVITFISLLCALLILSGITVRYRAQLAAPVTQRSGPPVRSLSRLLRQRYILHIFVYRMLITIGAMIVSFIMMSRAKFHFPAANELAGFLGVFGGAIGVGTTLFAILAAGWLLSRFGLRYGLIAGGSSLSLALLLTLAAGLFLTIDSPLFFWLLVSGAIMYAVLTDSLTFPSLKAVYQALPQQDKQQVETAADGIFMPLANGVSGILLLALNAIPGLTPLHLAVFALCVTTTQIIIGTLVYGGYRMTLLRTLSRRTLSDEEVSLADGSSLAAVEKLLQSAQPAEVRLALDLLEQADHPSLPDHLVVLAGHAGEAIRMEALLRIGRLRTTTALPAVETSLHSDAPPAVKGAAIRALCALQEADALEEVSPYLTAVEPAVRMGALVGLLQSGGIAGILAAGRQLMTAVSSPDPAERIGAAQVIGAVRVNSFHQPLVTLLVDEDLAVRRAALAAAQGVIHPRLLPLLVVNLADPATRSAALAALNASGELVLPLVGQALAAQTTNYDANTVRRIVRVCGQVQAEGSVALLKRHLHHPDPELQQQILLTLHRCGYRAAAEDERQIMAVIDRCIRVGLRILLARQEMGEDAALAPLQVALAEEFNGVRQRVFLLLSFLYEPRALVRAGERLVRGASQERALALETLEVTLTSEQKALVLPLVDESQPLARRIGLLNRCVDLPSLERMARLGEIIADPATWPQGWTRACAIYAAGKLGIQELAAAVEQAQTDARHPVRETVAWARVMLNGASTQSVEPEAHAYPPQDSAGVMPRAR